jgi:hypothetical protein
VAKKTKRRYRFQVQLENLFDRVVAEQCAKEPALHYLLQDNPVCVQIPSNTSYLAQLEIVAASAFSPIPIESLSSELLKHGNPPRGDTVFTQAGAHIDQVASTCDLRWWITDRGLVMDRLEPPLNLSRFYTVAGRLMVEHFLNGRLREKDLVIIAAKLDEQKFVLRDHVQPSLWEEIAAYNVANSRKAIKTFQQAVGHPRIGPRAVRRALYFARDKFLKSQNMA